MTTKTKQRNQAVERIAQHILKEGLSKTSLRQLAAAADISDRMLLYYFQDKADVLTTVLEHLAQKMTVEMNAAIPEGQLFDPGVLFAQAATVVSDDSFRPYMRLGIEISAAAIRGEERFSNLSKGIAAGFILWLEGRLATKNAIERKAQAAMILGMLDGLAILDVCTEPEDRNRALQAMITSYK